MASQFPNGTVFAISTSLAAASAISGVSNANPGVATAATPPAAGDIVLLSSGWPGLNDRVVRAKSPAANSFQLEGFDTTSLTDYPAGAGAGGYQTAAGFVPLSQVRDVNTSGGDQQFFQWQYMEDKTNRQRQRPTFKNAKSIQVQLDYDPSLPWHAALIKADAANVPVVLRLALPNGAILYYWVFPSYDADPSKDMNQNMTTTATFSLISLPTRYEAG